MATGIARAKSRYGSGSVSCHAKYAGYSLMGCSLQCSDIDEEIHRVVESDLGFGSVENMSFLGGSSWSSCYLCETSLGKKVFAKTARGRKAEDMFLGEYLGLKAMFGEDIYLI